jgi:glycosyltransferase involved in cell wall biosynthesis
MQPWIDPGVAPGREPLAVSVVMPVYNGAQWLPAALESVLGQTLSDIEVLVVDDASTDESARLAEGYAARDPRVKVLRQPSNRGPAAARNVALDRARGTWVAIVDADDEIRPDRLRLLAEAGEREHADLIADGILFEGRGPGAPAELMTWRCDGPGLERLSAEALIRSGTLGRRRSLGLLKPLIRRRFLDDCGLRYAEDLRFAEDFNFYVRALFCGARFVLYPESHYVYRQRPASARPREVTRITRQALSSSQRLRAAVPAAGSSRLSAALDEYDQRWLLMSWFAQLKRGVADRRFREAVELLRELPASPGRVFRFACGRARMKWRAPGART